MNLTPHLLEVITATKYSIVSWILLLSWRSEVFVIVVVVVVVAIVLAVAVAEGEVAVGVEVVFSSSE